MWQGCLCATNGVGAGSVSNNVLIRDKETSVCLYLRIVRRFLMDEIISVEFYLFVSLFILIPSLGK